MWEYVARYGRKIQGFFYLNRYRLTALALATNDQKKAKIKD